MDLSFTGQDINMGVYASAEPIGRCQIATAKAWPPVVIGGTVTTEDDVTVTAGGTSTAPLPTPTVDTAAGETLVAGSVVYGTPVVRPAGAVTVTGAPGAGPIVVAAAAGATSGTATVTTPYTYNVDVEVPNPAYNPSDPLSTEPEFITQTVTRNGQHILTVTIEAVVVTPTFAVDDITLAVGDPAMTADLTVTNGTLVSIVSYDCTPTTVATAVQSGTNVSVTAEGVGTATLSITASIMPTGGTTAVELNDTATVTVTAAP